MGIIYWLDWTMKRGMMLKVCAQCTTENPEDNLFCGKCGEKFELEDANADLQESKMMEHEETINNTNQINDGTQRKSSAKVNIIISSTFLILVVVVIVSFVLNEPKREYDNQLKLINNALEIGKYENAYNASLNFQFNEKDKMIFEKVKFMYTLQEGYDNFQTEHVNTIKPYSRIDYVDNLELLLSIMKKIHDNENEIDQLGIQNNVEAMKEKVVEDLKTYFMLTDEEEINLRKNPYDEMIKKITIRGVEVKLNIEKQREIRLNPLIIENKKMVKDGNYVYVTGSVKNQSNESYSYIKVKVAYYDDDTNVVDTDWTYATSEPLRPNEQVYFEIMTKYREGMSKYKLSIEDYN